MRTVLSCAAAACAATLAPGAGADFDYPDFSSASSTTTLVGNAAIVLGTVELTMDTTWQSGAIWHDVKQGVAGGFTTVFEIAISPVSGADGMAFVIQNDKGDALGWCGGSLGYSSGTSSGCGGSNLNIADSLTVEFDTWQNGEYSDPSNNHVSVHVKGSGTHLVHHSNSLGSVDPPFNLNDGIKRKYMVSYDGLGKLEVFAGDLVTPLLKLDVDLDALLDLDGGEAWVGFTGATGGVGELHNIHSWSFAESFTPSELYGCNLNLPGSLVELSGELAIGETWTLGVDNPLGTQPPGSWAYVAVALNPDPAFPPCGTLFPAWGMAEGEPGELLVSVISPNPVLIVGPSVFAGAGTPAPVALEVPDDVTLVGTPLYFQGLMVDPLLTGLGLARAMTTTVGL